MSRVKAEINYLLYLVLGILIIYAPAEAQAVVDTHSGIFDEVFIFRGILSALLAVLIWAARGQDTRLRLVEKDIQEFHKINATRTAKLDYHEARLNLVEHEQKQLATLVSMQRELILTKYPDKDETERHRMYVEQTLGGLVNRIDRVEARLANYARATHRSTDNIDEAHG